MFTIKNFICKVIFITVFLSLSACHSAEDTKKIGIIIPLEHQALNEIVKGFVETLTTATNEKLEFKIANAQNDMNLQHAIIQQMQDENYALIVPVSSTTTEMTLALIHDKPIISLASSYTKEERNKRQPCNVGIVHDDIPPEKLINLIHQTYPQLTRLTLIHSPSEKIFPDVKKTIQAGKQFGITVNTKMISALPELSIATQAIPADTQGIMVLRDNLIASGISTLALFAENHHIPLITSDQGSVEAGGGFALGVHEKEIGVEGAKLAAAVLNHQPICNLPIIELTKLTVFINATHFAKEKQNIAALQQAAKKLNYQAEIINKGNSQ